MVIENARKLLADVDAIAAGDYIDALMFKMYDAIIDVQVAIHREAVAKGLDVRPLDDAVEKSFTDRGGMKHWAGATVARLRVRRMLGEQI